MERKYSRAKWHDYNSGIYFVTVCTYNKTHYFGKIHDNEIRHTEIGEFLCRSIEELSLHYPVISVDRYVVMPNHFHVIVNISGPRYATGRDERSAPNTGCILPPRHPDAEVNFTERKHFNSLLAQAIGGLKSTVTRQAHLWGVDFRWQANYHDHIIRDQYEYDLIANYIDNNVLNWGKDKFHSMM